MENQQYRFVCFKVESKDNKFNVSEKYKKFNDNDVDWSNPSTETLYKQVVNELVDYRIYEECFRLSKVIKNEPSVQQYKNNVYRINFENGKEKVIFLNLPYSKYEAEQIFENSTYFYMEIFSRDEDALNGYTNRDKSMKFDSDLYAIVLLKENNYIGHIYSWISPNNSDYCFALGIRRSVHFLFEESEKSVSRKLFEGVRQFALKKGAKTINVDSPNFNMFGILEHYCFESNPIDSSLLGKNLSYIQSEICTHNRTLKDISKSLINEQMIEFNFIESSSKV